MMFIRFGHGIGQEICTINRTWPEPSHESLNIVNDPRCTLCDSRRWYAMTLIVASLATSFVFIYLHTRYIFYFLTHYIFIIFISSHFLHISYLIQVGLPLHLFYIIKFIYAMLAPKSIFVFFRSFSASNF